MELTHINDQGRAKMVDVSEKADTHRIGVASGRIRMQQATFELITEGKIKKGDVLAVFYGNDPKKLENGMNEAAKAFRITDEPADRPVLIKKIIGLSQE